MKQDLLSRLTEDLELPGFGRVLVCGENLELARMTQRQLVITGRVEGVTLMRRGRP